MIFDLLARAMAFATIQYNKSETNDMHYDCVRVCVIRAELFTHAIARLKREAFSFLLLDGAAAVVLHYYSYVHCCRITLDGCTQHTLHNKGDVLCPAAEPVEDMPIRSRNRQIVSLGMNNVSDTRLKCLTWLPTNVICRNASLREF